MQSIMDISYDGIEGTSATLTLMTLSETGDFAGGGGDGRGS